MIVHTLNTKIPAAIAEFPNISIVLPFEPGMKTEKGLFALLKLAVDKLEKQLMESCNKEKVIPLIQKLRQLSNEVDPGDTQSVAILVSPQMGKIYYFTPSREMSNYYPVLPLV